MKILRFQWLASIPESTIGTSRSKSSFLKEKNCGCYGSLFLAFWLNSQFYRDFNRVLFFRFSNSKIPVFNVYIHIFEMVNHSILILLDGLTDFLQSFGDVNFRFRHSWQPS